MSFRKMSNVEFLIAEASANRFSTDYLVALNRFMENSQEGLLVIFKKDYVLLGNFQKYSKQLFFRNINEQVFPRIGAVFFLEYPWMPLVG